jgi:hypothetical protein
VESDPVMSLKILRRVSHFITFVFGEGDWKLHPRRIASVLRFYEPDSRFALAQPEFLDRLAKVQMEIDGHRQNAHVTFYKGYIFAVEFKKTRRFYAGKHIVIGGVSPGKPGDSYTRSIDRLEHGRDDEASDRS